MTGARELVIYGRPYCHLCDEMAAALAPLAVGGGWRVRHVDIDDDPVLEDRYGVRIPVLVHGATELCEHRLDEERVAAYLASVPTPVGGG